MRRHLRSTRIVSALAALAISTTAYAGSVQLAGGWEASWDPALDGLVGILDNGVVDGVQFFQKSAQFLDGPDGGQFPPIEILFTQTDFDAVGTFAILDEIITNSTGSPWTGFQIEVNGDGAVFDPAATLVSGGPAPVGWTIEPFNQAQFVNGNTRLDIFDGVVADGGLWFPGDGVTDGDLFINITPGNGDEVPFVEFTLIETPTPEPATAALLVICLAACRRRRA